ncbi:Cytochrome P450 [Mycena venus]|uniref:Cytochrome P450 n=1 Tax=Mycena venus TaxID=2733690 RepID=A0A8H6WYS8_9AGAR|nr:Cytochrome P450 [Mycena venus]
MSSSAYIGIPGFLVLLGLWLSTKLVLNAWRELKTIQLRGPPPTSRILGLSGDILQSPDISLAYEDWAAQYGPVFEVPLAFGRKKIVLTDPKALIHFYNSERSVYTKAKNDRIFIGRIVNSLRSLYERANVLASSGVAFYGRKEIRTNGPPQLQCVTNSWLIGICSSRQRKALIPAFSNAAIRRLTAVFYDSVYKLKSFWDTILESSSDGAIIEVEEWMNRIALDSVGIAGFSHDFRYLEGQQSPVTTAFEAMGNTKMSLLTRLVFLLSFTFPFVLSVPTERIRLFWELRRSLNVIARRLLANMRREKESGVAEELTDKSVIGLLLKAELADSELRLTQEEVVAQVRLHFRSVENVLLLAGYETTSIALTWALIELAKHPEIQDKLRRDLARFSGNDPTWDQLVSELPYLDATVHEVLRLHPPVSEIIREAGHDDVIPLGTPVVTPSGETISSVIIAKGTPVFVPIRTINRSEALWGPEAKKFKPERWFEDVSFSAKELPGHRHLLTFHDGPRTCLGKLFALAEFKAVLFVLIRNYVFEFPNGPETKIVNHVAVIPRPKVAGQNGAKVPLRVRRVE